MDFVKKVKETLISLIPIVILVLILNFTIAPLGPYLGHFLIGALMLFVGLTLFLLGADVGFSPVGERLGVVLAQKKNVFLLLSIGFLIGFAVTFAEPDVNVLAVQVVTMNPAINKNVLKVVISVSLGVFIDLGLLRSILKWRFNLLMNLLYLAVFALIPFAGQRMSSIAFDASGSTTGPLAIPFILGIGLGVSNATSGKTEDSFGFTGISSIGPVLGVLLLAFFVRSGSGAVADTSVHSATENLGQVFLSVLKNTAMGLFPLLIIIVVLNFAMLKFPPVKRRIIFWGILYGFVGIVVFLTGVEYGFAPVGRLLGSALGNKFSDFTVPSLIALLLGAIIVTAEPAVWVLTSQVEHVTAGRIKRNTVLLTLSIGVSFCVVLSVIRVYLNINYILFVFIFIGLALILSWFSPPLFTSLAFDSGGVASGPMSTSFVLSFIMGLSGSADLGFGVVGMIAMSPLVAIQLLGIIYKVKEKKNFSKKEVGTDDFNEG